MMPPVDVAEFKYLHLSHFQHLCLALPLTPQQSARIALSLNVSYITGSRFTQAGRIMAACPSPLPSFNHPQLPAEGS